GYPVRQPIGQVTMAYGGKAPFMAVTVIRPADVKACASIKDGDILIDGPEGKWLISREGVKRI
ncbi:MAG: hypothetical protein J5599_07130, partial [Spirochaetales bacterium]|nr:hypothetical protein [Spirochaetales bacterium]